jgi:hypothetical protein
VRGATAQRPSVAENKWDPEIRADLERRLAEIRVNPGATFSWTVRGMAAGLHPKLKERTTSSQPTRWSQGEVRDEAIPYVDAINRAQWLRSNVSAHGSRRHLMKLGTLDAINVQHLARVLLMNAVKFPWWHTRDVNKHTRSSTTASERKVL